MKKTMKVTMLLFLTLLFWGCQKEEFWEETDVADIGYRAKPGGETAGNNLSFPVIWAEGVAVPLRDPSTATASPIAVALIENPVYLLEGDWWHWWGPPDEVSGEPNACPPDPDGEAYCNDGRTGTTGPLPPNGAERAYLQKDLHNVWQAGTLDPAGTPVNVDLIDWGDNLESVDWYTKSKVRTEVVLYKNLDANSAPFVPLLEYGMRHVSGWGISEMHGVGVNPSNLTPDYYKGSQATVYSPCARFMIQKLLVPRENIGKDDLTWVNNQGWQGEGLINDPIFNKAVYEAGDGPGFYNAEVNIKGKIIFGYTWNVRKLNDPTLPEGAEPGDDPAAGDYRLTFSIDQTCPNDPNTFFENAVILTTEEGEEEVSLEEGDDGQPGGGTAAVREEEDLTFIDVRILPGKTGSNSGGGKGSGNSGNNGNGGGGKGKGGN